MRKSSKLLAVLLTLCLLFGAITAILVSADGEAADQLKVGDQTGYINTTATEVTNNSKGLRDLNKTGMTQYLVEILPTESNPDGYQYVTIDMDFYFDVSTVTDPASHKYMQLMTVTANTDAGNNKSIGTQNAYLVYNSTKGAYFLALSNTDTTAKPETKTATAKGVYDHLTYILKIDNDATTGEVTFTTSIYLNGNFVGESTTSNPVSTKTLQISRPATKASGTNDWADRKVGVNNFVINYFKNGTGNTTALEAALKDHAPLYNATSGVVYDANYVTPDAATNYVKVNGTPYTIVGKAMDEISKLEGDNNQITVSGRNLFVTLPDSIKKIEVTLENGADFDAGEDFTKKETEVAGVYTYERVASYAIIEGDPTEYSDVNEALRKLENGGTITLNNINAENFNTELNSFTVKKVNGTETFTLAAECAWRYVKIGDTYERIIDGDVMANVGLGNIYKMEFNIYIPWVEGLNYVAAYSPSTGAVDSTISDSTYMRDTNGDGEGDKKYIVLTWSGRMDYVTTSTKAANVEFKYTAAEGAEPINFVENFTAKFNYIQYAQYVAETYDCDSDEVKLVRAMTEYRAAMNPLMKDYSNESIQGIDTTTLNKFYDECNKHKHSETETCTCSTQVTADDYIKVGTTHGSEYKDTVYFGVSGRGIYLYVKATAGQYVEVSYTGVGGDKKRGGYAEAIDETTAAAMITGIAVTDIDNDFTITVYNVTPAVTDAETGEVITDEQRVQAYQFEYSLADFATGGEYAELVAALKKLAIAAENYKVDKVNSNTETTTPEAGE